MTFGPRGKRALVWSLVRFAAAALLVVVGVSATAPAATAHATLLFTTPSVDGAVPTSPRVIQLVFDQEVTAAASALDLRDRQGRAVPLGAVEAGAEANTVVAPVRARLPVGEYVVHWEVVARDGDAMVGEFRFAVGSSQGLAFGGGEVATEGVFGTSLLRWSMFLGLALAMGGLVGSWLAARGPAQQRESLPRPWAAAGCGLGLVAATGSALLVVGAGSIWRGLQRVDVQSLTASTPGQVALLELGAFAVALVALSLRRPLLGAASLLVVPVAEGIRAHPQAEAGAFGAVLTAVHLAAAAVWLGALVHVVRVGIRRRRQGASNVDLARGYARVALALLVLVLVTGTVAAWVVIPAGERLAVLRDTGYGRWLLAKAAVVVAVVALAGSARWLLATHPGRPQPGRAARFEVAGLVLVLGISGVLTALAPPTRSGIALPFPPPPVGPVVAVGTRAGFIGLGVSASQGQLLVRLSTPDVTADVDSRPGPSDLAGNLATTAGRTPAEVEFRRCGPGCFVAPVEWTRGQSTVTLHAEAQGWDGGTAAVQVAWPPRPAAGRLKAAVSAMRRVEHFTLHEQVTSDTTTGLGTVRRHRLSGREFLEAGPYGSGVAPTVTRSVQEPGMLSLALGYPGEGTYVLLTVGPDHRLLRETLVSGEHLVTRTFVYDDPRTHRGHDHAG